VKEKSHGGKSKEGTACITISSGAKWVPND